MHNLQFFFFFLKDWPSSSAFRQFGFHCVYSNLEYSIIKGRSSNLAQNNEFWDGEQGKEKVSSPSLSKAKSHKYKYEIYV